MNSGASDFVIEEDIIFYSISVLFYPKEGM